MCVASASFKALLGRGNDRVPPLEFFKRLRRERLRCPRGSSVSVGVSGLGDRERTSLFVFFLEVGGRRRKERRRRTFVGRNLLLMAHAMACFACSFSFFI